MVEGKRSPRWAIWSRMTIPCQDGLVYLVRLRIVQTPWFGIYLHDIYEPDGQDPHNHPWSFVSFVLRGSYTELVYDDPASHRSEFRRLTHQRFSLHRVGRGTAHRIVDASSNLKTLVFVGARPRERSWGFFKSDGSFVEWKIYEGQI